jgi:hypothetical protein
MTAWTRGGQTVATPSRLAHSVIRCTPESRWRRACLSALWRVFETSCCRGRPKLFYPVFVFRRQIQKLFFGKRVGLFGEATTAFGLFFQSS